MFRQAARCTAFTASAPWLLKQHEIGNVSLLLLFYYVDCFFDFIVLNELPYLQADNCNSLASVISLHSDCPIMSGLFFFFLSSLFFLLGGIQKTFSLLKNQLVFMEQLSDHSSNERLQNQHVLAPPPGGEASGRSLGALQR